MTGSAAWLSAFLSRKDRGQPGSSRPLYSYRCEDVEFERLGDLLRTQTRAPVGYYDRISRSDAALFCLYAAEWWRRMHEGGAWSWSGILDGVGWSETPWARLYEVVEEGLGYWRRPLLRAGARRVFLMTLACEGGLPLHLVRHQGTALRRYLLAVLEEFQLHRSTNPSPHELAARAARLLPQTLRQDVVYQLSAQLIDEIWKLQRVVAGVPAPIQELDRVDPGWRDRLPLLVSNDIAHALLNPLIEEAAKLARGRSCGLRMERGLRRVGERWVLGAETVVPTAISEEQLAPLFGAEAAQLPTRFDLYLEDETGESTYLALA